MRRPPRSPLFPSTTLSRSGRGAGRGRLGAHEPPDPERPRRSPGRPPGSVGVVRAWGYARSDRKSTRLNSSHANISYAVFCLKKKKIVVLDKVPHDILVRAV